MDEEYCRFSPIQELYNSKEEKEKKKENKQKNKKNLKRVM